MVKKVSIWLTLEPLLYAGEKHLAEISRDLKMSHATVRKQLMIFERIGLVEKQKKGRQTFYRLRRIPLLLDYLTIVEKERLIYKCSRELVLKEIVDFLHKLNSQILIFGSAVHSVRKANDIDLLVVGNFNKKKLKVLEKKLNISLHIINVKSLSDVSDALKEEIKKKHLIIQGSEVFVKWLIN